jgi:hypothetical protein
VALHVRSPSQIGVPQDSVARSHASGTHRPSEVQ